MLLEKEIRTNRYNYLIAVGGDGLVNLCLQLVAEKPICLGVIPAGTGNDFARATGFNGKSVDEIFSIVSRSKPVKIDLGKAVSADESKWFVQVLSTGFDAIVNSLANKMTWPRGKSKYTIATILILSRFKSIPYMVEQYSRLTQICAPDLRPILVKLVDETFFEETERGSGGFGSTGN